MSRRSDIVGCRYGLPDIIRQSIYREHMALDKFLKCFCITLLAVVVMTACDSDDSGDAGISADSGAGEIVTAAHYVPADTLIYGGGLEPITAQDFSAAMGWFDIYSGLDWTTQLEEVMKSEPPGARMSIGLFIEYLSALAESETFFQHFAMGDEIDFAMYTVGIIPVFRYRITDQIVIDELLASVEKKYNVQPVIASFDDIQYRRYPFNVDAPADEQVDFIVAVHDEFVVFTIDAGFSDDDALKLALGIDKPNLSLAASDKLKTIVTEHDFLPNYLGFVDHVEIVKGLTGENGNRFGAMLANIRAQFDPNSAHTAGDKLDELTSESCRNELGAIAEKWPKSVLGYTRFDSESDPMIFDADVVVESSDIEMLKQLRTLRGVIPPFASIADHNPVFEWSMGVDIDALVPFATATWQDITSKQYGCPLLANFAQGLAQSNPAMMGMATAFVAGVKGITLSVLDVELDAGTAGGMPQVREFTGLISLAAENPLPLYTAASSVLPGLQGVAPPVDGKSIDLPLPMAVPGGPNVVPKLTIVDKYIVMYTGDNVSTLLDSLTGQSLEPNGFFAMRMDYAKYMELLVKGMPATTGFGEQDRQLMESMTNINGAISGSMDFEENGIKFKSRMEIRQ